VPGSRSRTRLLAGLLLGLAVLFWPASWPWLVKALSPYAAVCSAIALRSASLASLIAAPMVVLPAFRRRFWCRHLCPVGLIAESCGNLRERLAPRNKPAPFPLPWPPGRFIVLATLGGALLGYPFLLWMDPLALFGGAFNISQAGRPGFSWLSLAGLPAVMAISVLWPTAWCSRLCPLGAAQDLLALAGRAGSRQAPLPAESFPARRALFSAGAGALLSAAVPLTWPRRHPLRPPGSTGETAFQGACIRCGSCVRVCPTGIIQPDLTSGSVAGLLAPTLRFSGPDYCLQDCNRCGQVCPTGVIRPLPLKTKNRHVIGIAHIDRPRCLLTQEVECGVCVPRCPRGAIVDGFDRETYTASVEVDAEKCNGCGACVGICPPKVITVEASA
jgi:ferredoxin-type protein NapF